MTTLNEAVQNLILLAPEIWQALGETALMLFIGLTAAVVLGGPLGVLLYLSQPGQLFAHRIINVVLDWLVNLVRSFPFIILMVSLVPLTRALVGSTIGPLAAAVPLSFAAIPYFARLVEQSLREIPRGTVEAAEAMGAGPLRIIGVLLSEARAGLILSLTILFVSFLSYSAVAGVVGGGGIGDLAIRYGYYRFQTEVMVAMVLLLVGIVQVVQFIGHGLASHFDKR